MSLVLLKLWTAAAAVSYATTSPLVGARFSSQLLAVLQLMPAAPVQCSVAGASRSSSSSTVGRMRNDGFFLDRTNGVARERSMRSPRCANDLATGSCQRGAGVECDRRGVWGGRGFREGEARGAQMSTLSIYHIPHR